MENITNGHLTEYLFSDHKSLLPLRSIPVYRVRSPPRQGSVYFKYNNNIL